MSNTSRPQSANSRSSRSHVPSLASQAFFRPMSSQRLQAQRNNRPILFQQTAPATSDKYSDTGSNINIDSTGSKLPEQGPVVQSGNELPPPSRGTEFTDQDDQFTRTGSPTGNTTALSGGESEKPLQGRTGTLPPSKLDFNKNYQQGPNTLGPIERSPRSFRASFLMPSRSGANSRNEIQGRQRLASVADSTKAVVTASAKQDSLKAGINYQYFEGNTVFCWGGRLQNTRDRPINVATAIIVILPSVLFFIYSYVNMYLRPEYYVANGIVHRAPWLWHNVSPAIPIVFAYFVFICLSSLIHASMTNPGVSLLDRRRC